MIQTHSIPLTSDNLNFDTTPGFEMAVEKNWHMLEPVGIRSDLELYDSDLRKLQTNKYAIRIFYKAVIPMHYIDASNYPTNPLVNESGLLDLSNGTPIGIPCVRSSSNNNLTKLGLVINNDITSNAAYKLPDDRQLNHTYIKKSDFATGTSILTPAVNSNELYTILKQYYGNVLTDIYSRITFTLLSSDRGNGGVSSATISNNTLSYAVTTDAGRLNVPTDNTGFKHLMPLLFRPMGMAYTKVLESDDPAIWFYVVFGVTEVEDKTTYVVTFKDWNGAVLKTENVIRGESATPPENPVRDGYTFVGWEPSYQEIMADTNIVAQYIQDTPVEPTDGTFFRFINPDGWIMCNQIQTTTELSGEGTVKISYSKNFSDINYNSLRVVESGTTFVEITNYTITDNYVTFTDSDVSTKEFYGIVPMLDGQVVGQSLWDDGFKPTEIVIRTSTANVVFTPTN